MKSIKRLVAALPLLVVAVGLVLPAASPVLAVDQIKCSKGQQVVDGQPLFFVVAKCSADCASFFAEPIPRQDAMAAALIATGKNPVEGADPPTLQDINIAQGHNCYSNLRCCARAVTPKDSKPAASPTAPTVHGRGRFADTNRA